MSDKKDKIRQEKNKDLIDRMRKGESLSQFVKEESWYPKRPKIKKDQKEMNKLYGEEGKDADTVAKKADV